MKLIISYVGFESQELTAKATTPLHVLLQLTDSRLNEAVVVGYATQKRKDVTGSIASVKGAAIKDLPVTNVTEALQGRAAGVEVIKNSVAPDVIL